MALRIAHGAFRITQLALFLGVVLFIAQSITSAQDTGETLSLSAYQARLGAAREALLSGADLSAVQRDLRQIDSVRLNTDEVLAIEPLLADVSNREVALSRLALVIGQLDAAANDQAPARLALLDTLSERLALDRPTLWQRIWRWIEDLLNALLPDQLPRGADTVAGIGSRLLVWTLVISGGVLLAILVSYWLQHLLGGILLDAALGRRQSGAPVPQTAAEAREQAQYFAQSGDYREAVRRLYLSALLHLDEAGLLRFERDQTNREVLAQVPSQAPVRVHLEPVVETFDRVWYGIREPDHETFEAYRRAIDGLMAETGEPRRG